LQISYESRKFMLPIRLGMVNATKEQDLIIYILSPKGQAEITNYRTVLTMANDFQGDVKDFAIVVPVPTVLQKEQVHVAEPKIIERLDAF
ncbi:MAG: DUF2330 domain-containing protein, partial [Dolichospermum sp.]